MDLERYLGKQKEWSLKTFGPGGRDNGIVDHIEKELEEIRQSPGDLTEWIDVIILALDGAWRIGFTPEQIVAELIQKQAVNKSRTWPDWRTAEPGKAIEHIRAAKVCKDTWCDFWDGTGDCWECPLVPCTGPK